MSQENTLVMVPPSQQKGKASHEPNVRVIAAIDFGTTHSGYASAHISDKEIHAHYLWDNQPVHYSKNLTAILYKTNGIISLKEAWGYTAQKLQADVQSSPNDKEPFSALCLCDRFKLYLDESITEKPLLPPGLTVIDVITDLLRSVYSMFLNELSITYGDNVHADSVVWYLTVPAMWTERSKQQMRKAAVLAGIVPENTSGRLHIVLEPDAAAMWCCEKSSQNMLQSGETLMIVDAGGGTVDLAAFEIVRDEYTGNESLKEISPGAGAFCGSTFVDQRFVKFLEERCGIDAVHDFRSAEPSEWLISMGEWERFKCQFKGESSFKKFPKYLLPIPKKLSDRMDAQHTKDTGGELAIKLSDMLSIFDHIVDEVLELIEAQLEQAEQALRNKRQTLDAKIDKMFLVGGFFGSEYLLMRVKERFGKRVGQIFRPNDPGSAVLRGAVSFGLNPSFISARCARLTYGVKVSGPWTPDNPLGDSAKYWNKTENMYYANNLFHAVVSRGAQVGIDEAIPTSFIPVDNNQDIAKLELYTTDRTVEFIVPSMKLAATLEVPLAKGILTVQQRSMKLHFIQDVSGSMGSADKLDACKVKIKEICENLNSKDQVQLTKFNDKIETLSEMKPYSQSIESCIDGLCSNGGTKLYDAIFHGIKSYQAANSNVFSPGQTCQNVLMVFTDGEEDGSSSSSPSVIKAILRTCTIPNFHLIFAIAGSSIYSNGELVQICEMDEFKDYCTIIHAKDSKEDIMRAFNAVADYIQLLKNPDAADLDKVIRLDMKFGSTEVTANAVNKNGSSQNIRIEFLSNIM